MFSSVEAPQPRPPGAPAIEQLGFSPVASLGDPPYGELLSEGVSEPAAGVGFGQAGGSGRV